MKFLYLKLVLSLVLAFLPAFAHAGAEHNLVGWAWSSNIGWISFNSTNDHDPNTAGVQQSGINYGVHKSASGDLCGNNGCSLPGYAWSPAIGWIQFGGLSSFPSGSGTQGINAAVNGTNLQGWARALSYDASWDGWISLSGAGPSYGVSLFGSTFSGYAWGSDVLGWINFDNVQVGFDPASFTLGGASDTVRIQFLVSGSSDSEIKTIPVTSVGGYSSPVTVSISTFPTPPVDTVFSYSLGGGAFSSTTVPSVIVSPGNSTTLQVRVSKPIASQYTVVVRGVGASAPTIYKNMILNPSSQDPGFEEF